MESYHYTVLADNRIEVDEYKKNPDKYLMIECFLFNLPENPSFSCFSKVTELRIIEQDIKSVKWLVDVPNLVILEIFHTKVFEIVGLDKTPKLRVLYLDNNQISSFPDISFLPNLEKLTMSYNPINEIKTFPNCPNLKYLNIASTGISYLDKSLTKYSHLQYLNISSNPFIDFSSFGIISSLSNLSELYFYDPHYGESLVCKLPNYDVMLPTTVTNPSLIDTFSITPKFRSICENRKKEVLLYYQTVISTELDNQYLDLKQFIQAVCDTLSGINPQYSYLGLNLQRINEIINQYVALYESINEIITFFSNYENDNGGLLHFQRITEGYEEWNNAESIMKSCVVSKGSAKLTYLWELTSGFTQISDVVVSDQYFIVPANHAYEVIDYISNWSKYSPKTIDSYIVENELIFLIFFRKVSYENYNWLIPAYFSVFSIQESQLIFEIESMVYSASKSIPVFEPINNGLILKGIKTQISVVETLTTITLLDCGINSLSLFQGLHNLERLELPFNEISTLKNLPNLPSLKYLDLSFNEISEIQNLFPLESSICQGLSILYLFGNYCYSYKIIPFLKPVFPNLYLFNEQRLVEKSMILTGIRDRKTFNGTTVLNLSNANISSLKFLNDFPNLDTLNVSDNLLISIDFKSPTLRRADFSNNLLTSFPDESSFPILESLHISNNMICILKSFKSLVTLLVSGNMIDSFPSTDFFPRLCVLSILDNPICSQSDSHRFLYQFSLIKYFNGEPVSTHHHSRAQSSFCGILFPEDLSNMLSPGQTLLDLDGKGFKDVNILSSQTLQTLLLSNNSLSEIKWSKESLPNLMQLKLSKNQMASFQFLDTLKHLRVLDLSSNEIGDSALKALTLSSIHSLKHLNLSNNSIRTLQSIDITHFPSLEVLDLSHNYIALINKDALTSLKLQSLNLSYNSLKKMDFLTIPSLLTLDVSHNRVSTVDEVVKLRGCSSLVKFWFNDNPLTQRIVHRIRVLVILRSLKELDGRPVMESDLIQVQTVLEQSGGQQQVVPQAPPGKVAKVNNVIMQPQLPMLHENAPTKRKPVSKR